MIRSLKLRPLIDSVTDIKWAVLNGRNLFITEDLIEEITVVNKGKCIGILRDGTNFEIIGGRASGGATNEWFVSLDGDFANMQNIPVRSCAEALRLAASTQGVIIG